MSLYSGFQDDNVPVSGNGPRFGLNAGVAKLTAFEWIPNAGAGGTAAEALEIKFQVGEKEISYRKFPVTRAYDKNNQVITDLNSPEIKEEAKNFSAIITHILHCFASKEAIKAAFEREIADFKAFCQIARGLLPANFAEIPLDIFFQYQWNFGKNKEGGTNSVTFLEIPSKMNQGKWLAPLRSPAPGVRWEEVKNPAATEGNALYYRSVNADGTPVLIPNGDKQVELVHPFARTSWFLGSNFATQQKVAGAPGAPTGTSGVPTLPPVPPAPGQQQASGWD